MKKKNLTALLLTGVTAAAILTAPAHAVEKPADIQQAAAILYERGIYQGDGSGSLNLDKGLTRAELAAILTRLHIEDGVSPDSYAWACYFADVPAWARPYAGYCVASLLMRGYDSSRFGPNDPVNPAMACTVVLRGGDHWADEGREWSYQTAGQYAAGMGLLDPSTAGAAAITRGEMAVLLCRASGWSEAASQGPAPATAPQKAVEATPDGKYTLRADHWSREDFSQRANPAVFTGIYDRALYNTLRQTMVDTGTDKSAGVNCAYTMVSQADYGAVKRLAGRMYGVTRYEDYAPKSVTNYYQYPGYFAVSAETPEICKAPLAYIQPVIAEANGMQSDSEKVRYLNDYLCTKLDYRVGTTAGLIDVFSDHEEGLTGSCGSYAVAFNFLCSAADIPCMMVSSHDHTWNMVYADGQWLHVDAAANDVSAQNYILLSETNPNSSDIAPEATAFLKELLVPGSTR